MPKNEARGTALLEAVPVILLLTLFASGTSLAVYLFFMRAWIQYQSEQALYCASERRPRSECQMILQKKLDEYLPWGESRSRIFAGSYDRWTVEVQWNYGGYSLHSVKALSPQQILAVKALRW